MLIKICGMKEPGNVKEVAALHPDMLLLDLICFFTVGFYFL